MTEVTKQIRIREKHPRVIRWTHWVNFPVLTLMIWSGILIYWANDIYFLVPFAKELGIEQRLAEAKPRGVIDRERGRDAQ